MWQQTTAVIFIQNLFLKFVALFLNGFYVEPNATSLGVPCDMWTNFVCVSLALSVVGVVPLTFLLSDFIETEMASKQIFRVRYWLFRICTIILLSLLLYTILLLSFIWLFQCIQRITWKLGTTNYNLYDRNEIILCIGIRRHLNWSFLSVSLFHKSSLQE